MRENEIQYTGPLTATIADNESVDRSGEGFGITYDPIQRNWEAFSSSFDPADIDQGGSHD